MAKCLHDQIFSDQNSQLLPCPPPVIKHLPLLLIIHLQIQLHLSILCEISIQEVQHFLLEDNPGLNGRKATAATVTLHILRLHPWRLGYREIVVDDELRFAQRFLGPEFSQPLFVDYDDSGCIHSGKLSWCLLLFCLHFDLSDWTVHRQLFYLGFQRMLIRCDVVYYALKFQW